MTLFVVVVNIVDFQIKVICSMFEHENNATVETHCLEWAQQHHQLKKHTCNAHVSFKHHLQTTLFVVVVNIVDFQC